MTNITFLSQLIDSLEEHVNLLEKEISSGNTPQANKLRAFIFDIHKKIDAELTR